MRTVLSHIEFPIDGYMGQLLFLILFRTAPFAVFAVLAKAQRVPLRWGVATTLIVLGSVFGAIHVGDRRPADLVAIGGAYTYYVATCFVTYALTLYGGVKNLGRGTALAIIVSINFLPPLAFLPQHMTVIYAILAWDVSFAGYSYFVENRRRPDSRLPDCLFFILVDPTLLYTERSQPAARARRGRGLRRFLMGCGVMSLSFPLLYASGKLASLDGPVLSLRTQLLLPAVGFLSFYSAHSGLASLQIGSMGMLGWETPERYIYPLLSRSPADFWNRWNRYLGQWFARYVYYPLGLRLARRANGAVPRSMRIGMAILTTFLLVGVAHDGIEYVKTLRLDGQFTVFFLCCGFMVLLAAPLGTKAVGFARHILPRLSFLAGGVFLSRAWLDAFV